MNAGCNAGPLPTITEATQQLVASSAVEKLQHARAADAFNQGISQQTPAKRSSTPGHMSPDRQSVDFGTYGSSSMAKRTPTPRLAPAQQQQRQEQAWGRTSSGRTLSAAMSGASSARQLSAGLSGTPSATSRQMSGAMSGGMRSGSSGSHHSRDVLGLGPAGQLPPPTRRRGSGRTSVEIEPM